MSFKDHFLMMAAYNAWANGKAFSMAQELTQEEWTRDMGAFFKSACGTLNHIMVADYLWLHRLTGEGPTPPTLDTILHEDRGELWEARQRLDSRIHHTIAGYGEEEFTTTRSYQPMSNPVPTVTSVKDILTHIFNHQAHHRGQLHTIFTALGKPSLVLDLIFFLRERG